MQHQCGNELNEFAKSGGPNYKISYDNAKVTIELRRTSNLQNIPRRTQGTIHLENVRLSDSVRKLTCDIARKELSTSYVTIASRSYDNLMINRKIFCKSGPWSLRTLV